ncbi:PPE domain-containing protein [Nocardia suismassiliense]|uniref:PPE domain-containing protein n=1 Tax=Nocardia suismassiliense TaxID=2077092 RepID=UPI000D1EACD6|nr:PPE domain-containing protein [Nocardia suismassiliense]
MSQDDYRARIIAAQQQWNDERTAIYSHRGKLAQDLEQGYDPPSITNPGEDLFAIETGTLQNLVSKVEAMKPGQAWEASQMWQNISVSFREKSSAFGDSIKATVANGWRGQAANQAVESVSRYVDQSRQLTLATELISVKLNELYTGLHQTQALMPRASDSSPDLAARHCPAKAC